MSASAERLTGNRLLDSLPPDDRRLLDAELEPLTLEFRHGMVHADEPPEHVYFPTSAVGSVITTLDDGTRLEAGIFGRDGFSAPFLLLGVDRTPQEYVVQVAGGALRIGADRFMHAVDQSPSLRTALLKYVHVFNIQAAHTAVSNGVYTIEARLARWLLMCHDRLDTDTLPLTHEFLAIMLAVRRSGVTAAVHILEGAGLIRAQRGFITVLRRDKLQDLADGSYGPPEAEYERLIGPLRRWAGVAGA